MMAYTQAPVEWDMYMEIPKGFEVEGDGDYVLQIHKNIYGQKRASHVWNKHLVGKLKSIRFHQCQSEECMFMQGKAIYVLYTNDSILTRPDLKELDSIIEDMKQAGLELMVEGDISDFLGVNIQCHNDGMVHLTQPHLIDSILKELGLQADSAKSKATPAASSKLLVATTTRHLMTRKVFTTGTSSASSTTLRRAPIQTSPTPHTNVPTFLPIQGNLILMQSSG